MAFARVAIAHPPRKPRATAGFMTLAGISGDPKYRDAMLAMGGTNGWKLGPRKYMADDQCIGQTYAKPYFLYRDPKMIAPVANSSKLVFAPAGYPVGWRADTTRSGGGD